MLMAESSGILAGLRVLDVTTGGALLCGRLLADLGAEVIAIEPTGGNPARFQDPFWHDQPGPDTSLYWLAYSHGKRSVTVDLQQESDRAVFQRLASTADVLVESYPPGYLAGLGLGYQDLTQHNPRLIFTSITPFGQTGPRRHYRATDLILMALGGSAFLTGEPDRAPLRLGVPQAELHAGAEAVIGTLLALQYRHQAGVGQHVDVAAQACVVWTLMNATHYAALGQANRNRQGAYRVSLPGKRRMIYPCKDGYVSMVFFGGAIGGRSCRNLVQWMAEAGGAPEELRAIDWQTWDDVYLASLGPQAQAEIERVECAVLSFFARFTMRELYEQALRRHLLLAPVADARTIIEDPQLQSREFWRPVLLPALGVALPLPGPFARFSASPLCSGQSAPRLGEHNDTVLGQQLGYTASRICQQASPAEPVAPRSWPRPPLPQGASSARPRRPPQRLQQPLHDVRVLDFTWYGVGPIGTKYLADHGAQVLKVESALYPDGLRQAPPWSGEERDLDNSQFFAAYNTSKRSMALNLRRPAAQQLVLRLVQEWANVVSESFTPGTMAKWGLDYSALQRLRPELIMLSTCMQGQTGPHAHYAGFGNTLAALSGFYQVTGYPDSGPMPMYGAYTDFVACRFAGIALLAALEHRRRTGAGQHIDLSQYEASLHLLTPTLLDYAANEHLAQRRGNQCSHAAPHGIYRCKGIDRWCAIAVTNEDEWQAFCQVLGNPGWACAPNFATFTARLQHRTALDRHIEAWTQRLPSFTVMELLQTAGVPAGVVQNATDLHRDPQLQHRGFFVETDHPRMGLVRYDGHQFLLSESPGALWSPAPLLGQHTDEVLRDILRLPATTIAELRRDGVWQ
jgi:crotonobetainyl-CoA:carnitine CoA-transferase CaiB-like acyl-CoA transferase